MTLCALAASASADLPRYLLVDLPNLGGNTAVGMDVNDRGLVIGISTRHGENYEVVTTWQLRAASPLTAPAPRFITGSGFSFASGNAVNHLDQIAGISDELGIAAFVGTVSGVAVVPSMSALWGEVFRMNDAGAMVGQYSGLRVNGWRPFVVRAGVHVPLPTLGGLQGAARGISNSGQIVGDSDPLIGLPLATRWVADQPVELPGLGGWGSACGVNDAGIAVGFTSNVGSNPFIAAVWSASNQLTLLPTLDPDHWDNRALDINARNQIVGTSAGRAFIFENTRMTDLNTVTRFPAGQSWTLYSALAISENGMIVGEAIANQERRGFLLLPRCPADFNADALATIADVFAFLNAWFSSDADADHDQSGELGVIDIFAFLNSWFGPC